MMRFMLSLLLAILACSVLATAASNPITINLKVDVPGEEEFYPEGMMCGSEIHGYEGICELWEDNIIFDKYHYDNVHDLAHISIHKYREEPEGPNTYYKYYYYSDLHISPRENKPIEVTFDKKIEIKKGDLPDGISLSIGTKQTTCIEDPVFTYSPTFSTSTGFEAADEIETYLPDFADVYDISLFYSEQDDPDDWPFKDNYYIAKLENNDVITIKWPDIYVNDKKITEKVSLDKLWDDLYSQRCYRISERRYEEASIVDYEGIEEPEKPFDEEYEQEQEAPEVPKCPKGYELKNGKCVAIGCTKDSQCKSGEVCDKNKKACVKKEPECKTEKDCSTFDVCVNGKCQKPNFVLIIYPQDGYTYADVKKFKDDIVNNFAKGLNIDQCKETIKVIPDEPCPEIKYGDCGAGGLKGLQTCFLAQNPSLNNYKLITLGIGKKGPSSGSAGRACGDRRLLFAQYVPGVNENTPVHEMGHVFGLVDEYCYNLPGNTLCNDQNCNLNPTDPALDGDDAAKGIDSKDNRAYCKERFGYSQVALGNKWNYPDEGRARMSYSGAPGPRSWDKYEIARLNEVLKCA